LLGVKVTARGNENQVSKTRRLEKENGCKECKGKNRSGKKDKIQGENRELAWPPDERDELKKEPRKKGEGLGLKPGKWAIGVRRKRRDD